MFVVVGVAGGVGLVLAHQHLWRLLNNCCVLPTTHFYIKQTFQPCPR